MQIVLAPSAPDISALENFYHQSPTLTRCIDAFMAATVECRKAYNKLDVAYDRQQKSFEEMCQAYQQAVADRGQA
jgi:hypothetical protein